MDDQPLCGFRLVASKYLSEEMTFEQMSKWQGGAGHGKTRMHSTLDGESRWFEGFQDGNKLESEEEKKTKTKTTLHGWNLGANRKVDQSKVGPVDRT